MLIKKSIEHQKYNCIFIISLKKKLVKINPEIFQEHRLGLEKMKKIIYIRLEYDFIFLQSFDY